MIRMLLCGAMAFSLIPSIGWAQSANTPRVAVSHSEQADAIRFLAADLVEVQSIKCLESLTVENYEQVNYRMLSLRDVTAFVYDGRCDEEPVAALWRDRLSAHGVHVVSLRATSGEYQLKQLHRLLCDLLPKNRKSLDANLDLALRQLRQNISAASPGHLVTSP